MPQRNLSVFTVVEPEFMSMVRPLGGASSERIDTAGFSFPRLLLITLAVVSLLLTREAVTAGAASGAAKAATISGKALFADTGKPADGVTVRVSGRGGWMEERETDRKGDYSFTGIRPGTYEVSFYDKAAAVKNTLPEFAPGTLRNITVQAGQLLRNIDMRLARGGIVTGRVTKADTGIPVPGIRVYEYDGKATVGVTDRNGVYRMRVNPGKARIYTLGPAPDGYALHTAPVAVAIAAGRTVEGIDFKFHKVISVTGKILSPEGAPVSDAWFAVTRKGLSPEGEYMEAVGKGGISGPDGTVLLKGLTEGEPATLTVEKKSAGLRGSLKFVPRSGETVALHLENYALRDLEGRVVDESGAPVSMAKVSFSPSRGAASSGAYSNSMGKFRLIGLEAGKNYRITVEAKGYRKRERDLLPVTGRMTTLQDIVLKKSPE